LSGRELNGFKKLVPTQSQNLEFCEGKRKKEDGYEIGLVNPFLTYPTVFTRRALNKGGEEVQLQANRKKLRAGVRKQCPGEPVGREQRCSSPV